MTAIRDFLSRPRLFAEVMIVLSFLASARYGYQGDWGRVAYWLAGAVITLAVTFWIKD